MSGRQRSDLEQGASTRRDRVMRREVLHEARLRRRGSRRRAIDVRRVPLRHQCVSAGLRAGAGLVGLLNTQTLQPGDVVKDPVAAVVTTQTVARALSIELATIPITSSAGGFVYRFNRSLAVVERASDSFGPFFAERALRPGRHQASLG
jgi:hypothetical protein